jgi:O-antigen/teichoic acid export membrane protein
LFQKLLEKNGNRFMQKNFLYATFVIMIVYIFIASFSQEIILLIAQNEDYYRSYQLIPILGLAYIFHAANYFYNVLHSYSKNTIKIFKATLITAICTILLNFLLVPQFKIYAAAMINVFSAMILFSLLHYFSRDVWRAFFELRKFFMIICVGLMIVVINTILFREVTLLSSFVKLFFCLSFPFLLYPFRFYEKIEIDTLKQIPIKLIEKIRHH